MAVGNYSTKKDFFFLSNIISNCFVAVTEHVKKRMLRSHLMFCYITTSLNSSPGLNLTLN